MSKKNSLPLGRLILLSLIAALAGFLLGVDLAVVNGTVIAVTRAFGSSRVVTGFGISVALLGSAVGALFAGQLSDRFGRKPMMLVTAVLFLLGTWGVGAANSVTEFGLFRFLGGIAAGAGSVITPAYLAEIAPARIRGRLIIVQQLAIVVAIMITFLTNYGVSWAAGGAEVPWLWGFAAWRWMFWIGLLPCFAYLVSVFVLPESPRYLVGQQRDGDAAIVMNRLWGGSVDTLSMVGEIRTTLQREHVPRFRDLIVHGKVFQLLPVVWLGVGLGFCQQSNGINVILYYGEVLWKTVGFAEHDALLINVLMGAALILATITAMGLIDRMGRKPLLIAGSIGMIVTLGWLTILFASSRTSVSGELELSRRQAISALVAAHGFIFCYGTSWAPVTWVLLGEMFPNRIRGGGIAVGGATVWLTNFVVTLTFPILLNAIGLTGSYVLYTTFTVASLVFVLRWVKETKGQSLETMDDLPLRTLDPALSGSAS